MRFTIVTPSFNQGAFIERTIESVLGQRGDFELEYLIVDGGLTDGTLDVLRRYDDRRLTWISERDGGQSEAINKGFGRATGDVLAWLNSDDTYVPGALDAVSGALRTTAARWCFGECAIIDEQDREIRHAITWYKNRLSRRYTARRLLEKDFIPQPAAFFRRDLLEEVGSVDEACRYSMDYDLWLRFARVLHRAIHSPSGRQFTVARRVEERVELIARRPGRRSAPRSVMRDWRTPERSPRNRTFRDADRSLRVADAVRRR